MLAVKAKTILTPYRTLKDAYLIIRKDRIVGVSRERPIDVDEIRAYDDCIITPGLVDIHMHGGFGVDILYSSSRGILELSKKLLTTGVTSYMPSIVTASLEDMKSAIRNLKEAAKSNFGSKILGIHLEGPYLNPARSGAQPRGYIRKPSFEEFEEFYRLSDGMIRRVTVAPEIDGGIEFIGNVVEKFGVKVSIGHTDATYDQALEAFSAGASIITHLYNGMRRFHHREPGIVGATLVRDVYAEIIADLVHLHPATITFTVRCKNPSRIVLVSDSISGAGLEDGEYKFGPYNLIIEKGVAKLRDGTLAGSTLTMIRAVRNMVKIGVSLKNAVRMATSTPSNAMGIRDIGKISRGCKADFIVLNKHMEVIEAYVDGKPILKEIQ